MSNNKKSFSYFSLKDTLNSGLIQSLLHYLVWVIWVRDGKDGAHEERECPLSPLCLPSGYLWYRYAGPCPSPLPTSETPLGIFFKSECSLYYWNVHKHSPNAWPVSKSPRYTYIWLSIWDHQIFCNKEKPEQQKKKKKKKFS